MDITDLEKPVGEDHLDIGALFEEGVRRDDIETAVEGMVIMDEKLAAYLDTIEISHLKPHPDIVPGRKRPGDVITKLLCYHACNTDGFIWTDKMSKRLLDYRVRYSGAGKSDFVSGSIHLLDLLTFLHGRIATRRDWILILLLIVLIVVLIFSVSLAFVTAAAWDVFGILEPDTGFMGRFSRALAGFSWLELALFIFVKLLWPNGIILSGLFYGRVEMGSNSSERDKRRRTYNVLRWILSSNPTLPQHLKTFDDKGKVCKGSLVEIAFGREQEVQNAILYQEYSSRDEADQIIRRFKIAILRTIATGTSSELRSFGVFLSNSDGESKKEIITVRVCVRDTEKGCMTSGSVSQCFEALVQGTAEVCVEEYSCSATGKGVLNAIARHLPPLNQWHISSKRVCYIMDNCAVTLIEAWALSIFSKGRYVTVRADDGRLVVLTPPFSNFDTVSDIDVTGARIPLSSSLKTIAERVIDDETTSEVWLYPWAGRYSIGVCILVLLIVAFYTLLVPFLTIWSWRQNLFGSRAHNIFLASLAEVTGLVGPFTLMLDLILSELFKDKRIIRNCIFPCGERQQRRVLAQTISHVFDRVDGEMLMELAQDMKGYKVLKGLIPARGCSYLTTAAEQDKFVKDKRELMLQRKVACIEKNGSGWSANRENESDFLIDTYGVLYHMTSLMGDRLEYHCEASDMENVVYMGEGFETGAFKDAYIG